jgi:DsbC/DsbD-like thiol-disulfide interchange protein
MAQSAPPAPVVWTLSAPDARRALAPGQRVEVTVRAVVEPGWYVYASTQPRGGPTALRITVPESQPLSPAGPITGPPPVRHWDPGFEIDAAMHAGTAAFTLPLQVARKATVGKVSLKVQVRYQACSDTLCLPPKTETLSLLLEIRARAAARPARE